MCLHSDELFSELPSLKPAMGVGMRGDGDCFYLQADPVSSEGRNWGCITSGSLPLPARPCHVAILWRPRGPGKAHAARQLVGLLLMGVSNVLSEINSSKAPSSSLNEGLAAT